MTKFKTFQFALISLLTLSTSTIVWAASSSDYEEVSYDDLVNELSHKKDTAAQKIKSEQQGKTHLGVGYANAFSNLSVGGEKFNRHVSGVQLSAGFDFTAPHFYGEGIFRNYGANNTSTETYTLRELDLKIGYTNLIEGIWNYSVASGLSTRLMSYSNSSTGTKADATTPSLVISTGVFAQIHRNVSIGAELGARTAMTDSPTDKDSFDFAFRLNTSL